MISRYIINSWKVRPRLVEWTEKGEKVEYKSYNPKQLLNIKHNKREWKEMWELMDLWLFD